MNDNWIGIDLDSTLAHYEFVPGRGFGEIGEPIMPMMNLVKKFIAAGKKVKIFTARAYYPEQIPLVKEWLKKHGLGDLDVTNIKDPGMSVLYDDKAIQVIPNLGIPAVEFFKNAMKNQKGVEDE